MEHLKLLRLELGNILRNFHRNANLPEADTGDVAAAIDAILRAHPFDDIGAALDRADVPSQLNNGKLLTHPERIALLAEKASDLQDDYLRVHKNSVDRLLEIAILRSEHGRRVQDLLETTNRNLERARAAEAKLRAACAFRTVSERPSFVDQTILYDPEVREERGNCTEAAVASILGLPLQDVPDFRGAGIEQFWPSFYKFFRSYGFEAICLGGDFVPDVLYLACGISPRDANHMVLMKAGELVHDPHPSKAGVEKPTHMWLVVPIDPGLRIAQ